jgi:predicted phosphate transport protein (TIGR00153 family)
MPSLSTSLSTADAQVLELFEESGANVRQAALLLRDLISDYPERADLGAELIRCEHEGDRLTHEIILGLNGGSNGTRGKLPIDPGDGLHLATALDDIVDYAEQAADELSLYGVEAPMEQAAAVADVLVGAAEQVERALGCLRTGADLGPHLVEIHRLENEGDRLHRSAVAALFANGIDPMVVIRWKDIFETLEQSVDACEKVAHVLEGIALKHNARRR